MRLLYLILSFVCSYALLAQDKIFFKNGEIKKGIIVSVARDVVFFKTSDTSFVQKIAKTDLVMTENYRGLRYVFADNTATTSRNDSITKAAPVKRHLLGAQPLGIFTGRGTVVYEHLSANDKIGWVVPLSITFDPFGTLYNSRLDTNRKETRRISGINFIAGLDVNFYIGQHESSKFFIGPRARYGTDLFLRGTEGYSLQTQIGWRYKRNQSPVVQHLSFGFGFVRILSSPFGRLINPRQSYSWISINYRVSLCW